MYIVDKFRYELEPLKESDKKVVKQLMHLCNQYSLKAGK